MCADQESEEVMVIPRSLYEEEQIRGEPLILGECRALWGERSEAWYRVTVAADAEAARYVKRVYVDYK